ncbi:hypothetical protein TrLO_g6930 [Triparma laevis f. longispina]|uniref:5'-3' DNA helicase ZGRF1-like N-terminal domain-containing protein n=1 Tax=Triparma laevis f. longispina TaxID=1714387 RepID=A0A9W7ED50_9STRA|nr:hypothetical protein TrLO_g6930 [Triparma laevis f. longispina]
MPATVRTLIALFTHQKNRKKKVFDDGFVKVNTLTGVATLHKDLLKQPIDTADLSKGELAELLSLSGDSIEFPKHLVECDTEYWPAGSHQAPSGAAVGVPQKIDTTTHKQKITQRKISVVKKLTSKKFVKPGKFIPKSNALRRQLYGASSVPTIAPLVPSRNYPNPMDLNPNPNFNNPNQPLSSSAAPAPQPSSGFQNGPTAYQGGAQSRGSAPPSAYTGIQDSDSDSDDDDDLDAEMCYGGGGGSGGGGGGHVAQHEQNQNQYQYQYQYQEQAAPQPSAHQPSAQQHTQPPPQSNPQVDPHPKNNNHTNNGKENQETNNNNNNNNSPLPPPQTTNNNAFAIKLSKDDDSSSDSSNDSDGDKLYM